MTNLEAIQNYIEPYTLSDGKLELLLDEQGLQASKKYDRDTMQEAVIKAAIEGLYSVMTIQEESDNGSKVKYAVENVQKLINRLRKKIGLEPEELEAKKMVRDATMEGIW